MGNATISEKVMRRIQLMRTLERLIGREVSEEEIDRINCAEEDILDMRLTSLVTMLKPQEAILQA